MTHTAWLSRYLAGEHMQVWHEMLAVGDDIRRAEVVEDAAAVSLETMKRVRHNIRLIVKKLMALDYRFDLSPINNTASHAPPSDTTELAVSQLESRVGLIPLSIKYFWTVVGSVDLTGYHPAFDAHGYADPLKVYSAEVAWSEYGSWEKDVEECGIDDVGAYSILISPDHWHKEGVSGSGSYCLRPTAAADALLLHERHKLFLVDYLRLSLSWGGFAGLDLDAQIPQDVLDHLRARESSRFDC